MKIDRSKLKMGIWYEDKDSNFISYQSDNIDEVPENAASYHVSFPLEVSERITFLNLKDAPLCKHPRILVEKDYGLLDEYHGIRCKGCDCYKVAKKHIPLMFVKWEGSGKKRCTTMTRNTHIGSHWDEVVTNMMKDGYTLSESICIIDNSCERCMNVLSYKYTDGKDGYPEFSEEWKKSNTVCDFCRG